jgi:hypothetical protein
MRLFKLFVAACLLAGLGGFAGSVVGNAFGRQALFAGGFLGGLLAAPTTAHLARWRGWIAPTQYWLTTAGAAVGFVAAALVAMNTLNSPIGPVLSTALTGLGAIGGSKIRRA